MFLRLRIHTTWATPVRPADDTTEVNHATRKLRYTANGVQAHALARYNASLGDGVGGPEEDYLVLSSRELQFHRNLPR